jgi:hypothetical protein
MGEEIQGVRGAALRSSGEIEPSPDCYQKDPEFQEARRRGEILVAAVLHAFVETGRYRLEALGDETRRSSAGPWTGSALSRRVRRSPTRC